MRRLAQLKSRTNPSRRALRLERLEDRCVLAGFGPEDGAIIVEPWLGIYSDVQIQPGDQKIVAAGGFSGVPGVVVARYDSQGNTDASYGNGGLANPSSLHAMGAANLVLQADGKAVVAGGMSNPEYDDPDDAIDLPNQAIAVGRLNADGSADTSFGAAGLSSFVIPESTYATSTRGVGLLSNGKIVVGGFISDQDPFPMIDYAFVAGFTASGALDTGNKGFGFLGQGYNLVHFGGKFTTFEDIAVQPDNKTVAVGWHLGRDAAGNTANMLVVARYTAAGGGVPGGIMDPSFNSNGYATLSVPGMSVYGKSVTLQADGKIVVVGNITGLDGGQDLLVARFTASGAVDTSFGGGSGYVRFDVDGSASTTEEGAYDVAIQPDGKIVAVGTLSSNGVSNSLVVRFNPNGTLDGTFGTGGVKIATPPVGYRSIAGFSAALAADGSIIVAGGLLTPDSNPDSEIDIRVYQPFVMRFLGDPPPVTKFYVVDDASANRTYEYADQGVTVENYALAGGNTAPRGAASTAAGDKVWVVDANRNVYVYNASGALLGSWAAGTLASNATVEGIATDGTDVWIVDARSDKVFRYAGAASRLSGSQTAADSFSLNSGNTSPKDLVTDGSSLWVVNNSTTDKVFKYALGGTLLGSWTIDAANATPTGLTIDPSNVNDIWIVDSGTDQVYQYGGATSRTSGSQATDAAFALAAGNTNPQGIADPPVTTGQSLSTGFVEGHRHAAAPVKLPARVSGESLPLGAAAAAWGSFKLASPELDFESIIPVGKLDQVHGSLLMVPAHGIGSVQGHGGIDRGELLRTLAAGVRELPVADCDFTALDDLFVEEREEPWYLREL